MDLSDDKCGSCGEAMCTFSASVSESNGQKYCIRCAEETDLQHLSKTICSVCVGYLGKQDIKFVMPSRMYSNYFFDRLPIFERLMCVYCYRKARKLNMINRPLTKIGTVRKALGKVAINNVDAKIGLYAD